MLRAHIVSIFPFLLALLTPFLAYGSNPLADEKRESTPTQRQAESLVMQLRSPNKDPNPSFNFLFELPREYDHTAQEKVAAAQQKLTGMGKDAFPILIGHLKDREYSCSISISLPYRSLYVGDVCFMIIEAQVDLSGMPYKARKGADSRQHNHPGYFSKYCGNAWYSQEGLLKWWNEHDNRSVREMQIEALEWTIDRERSIGFPDDEAVESYLTPLLTKLAKLKDRRQNRAQ